MNETAKKKIVIAGGSGFLGQSLAEHLSRTGAEIKILARSTSKPESTGEYIRWDARTCGDWVHCIDNADVIVNLVGRTVDCIKTPDHCDEILRSRVESTLALGEAVRTVDNPPPLWIQMSTAHIYGDPPDCVCTEDSPYGYGLAPNVGRAWEEAFDSAQLPQQRAVILRTSFVVGSDRGFGGGALSRLRTITRLGLGGTIGHGRQGMSWIHETDFNRIVARAIEDATMSGAYIVSSPNPESQKDFMRKLRRAMRVPIGLPAFEWMVRAGAHYLFRTDPELALYGRYVIPQRLLAEGFEFEFPELRAALDTLV